MGRALLRDEVPVGMCKVRALFSWSGESPQDLGFVEGDIIEVLNNGDGDWWTGKLKRNKQVGVFPRNFAEYVDPDQETMSAALGKSSGHKKKIIGDYQLETSPIDFSLVSLSDLAISDPQHGEEPSLVNKKLRKSHTRGHGSVSQLDPGVPKDLGLSPNVELSPNLELSPDLSSSGLSSQNSNKTALVGSTRSTKSAQEILDDIGNELNKKFLDDVNLDVSPEDLRTSDPSDSVPPPIPPPHTTSLRSSTNSARSHARSRSQSVVPETAITSNQLPKKQSSALTGPVIDHESHPTLGIGNGIYDAGEAANTSLPQEDPQLLDPQHLQDASSLNESFLQPGGSPMLNQEIPFDPKEFKPERSIGEHIGSHFDEGYSVQQPQVLQDSNTNAPSHSFNVISGPPPKKSSSMTTMGKLTKTPSKASRLQNESHTTSSYIPPRDTKLNFFQKLLPMNSQTLKRKNSRSSQKSSRSSKLTSPIASTLRSMKSKFSFHTDTERDESLYPSNVEPVISKPAPQITPNPPLTSSALRSSTKSEDTPALSPLAALTGPNLSGSKGSSSNASGSKWIESRRDLYRTQTLTERDIKKRRQELELQGVNCENIVAKLNAYSDDDFHDYRLESFENVDQAVLTMSTWPQLMTPSVFASSRIGRHFKDPVERVRAVFLLCSTRIEHVESTPVHNNVMQSHQATAQELAETVQAMCTGVGIECEIIEGHIRHVPNKSATHIISTTHWWNAVNINGEWRFLDARTAANPQIAQLLPEAEQEDDFVNLFYFLTPPQQMLFSHVPADHHKQFLNSTMPTATAALLPLAAPAAFAHRVYFDHYWLGATRLADLEVSELHLSVPDTTEDLVAFVNDQPVLAQPFYRNNHGNNERLFRVKAFVPARSRQALLQIYAVSKDQPSRDASVLERLWSVELRHVSGMEHNSPFEFVVRHAAPSLKSHDFYVLEPQCRSLTGGDTYTFRVENFSKSGHHLHHTKHLKQPQVAIQSPSGRLTRLVPVGTDVNDTFRANVKTLEVGTWRAVARQSEALGWAPFAEWFCT